MKKLLKVIFVLVVLLVIAWLANPLIVTEMLPYIIFFYMYFFVYYIPMFLIEAIALVWLFKDFSTLRAIFIAFVLYSITYFIHMFFAHSIRPFINVGIGIGLISLLTHLLLLKFQFKVSFSIKKISAIVFANIVYVAMWFLYKYEMSQRPSTITFC